MRMNEVLRGFRPQASRRARVAIMACAIALSLAEEALAQPQPGRTICFYVDKGVTGHVFVQFHPINNAQACSKNLVRGKYAGKKKKVFKGPGRIKNDSRRPWDQRICYTVTVAQYNAAAAKVNTKQAAPPKFNLLSANCVDWANDVAMAAGLTLPDTNWFIGIDTPGQFGRSLKAIGNGGVFKGGRVEFNPNLNIAPDGGPVASVVPNDWDTEEVALLSQQDPNLLAGLMEVSFNSVDLGEFSTTPGAGFAVLVSNATPGDAIITVDWGDGSDVDVQGHEFAHTYDPGLYNGSVAVVDCGAVNAYQWTVAVVAEGPIDNLAEVNVPPPFCADDDNEVVDFQDGTEIEPEHSVCQNNVREGDEQCDGKDDAKCPGNCLPDCTCAPGTKIPTVSEWGLIAQVVLLGTGGAVVFGWRRRATVRFDE